METSSLVNKKRDEMYRKLTMKKVKVQEWSFSETSVVS